MAKYLDARGWNRKDAQGKYLMSVEQLEQIIIAAEASPKMITDPLRSAARILDIKEAIVARGK